MMGYLFIFLWAALQTCFTVSFFASFLEVKHRKSDVLWVGIVAWLLTALFALFEPQGIQSYVVYLLSAVIILLAVHGEYGPKGLCLLIFAFLIPALIDLAVSYLTAQLSGLAYYLAVSCGKALPVVLVFALRSLFSAAIRNQK